jgi:hypothetical protein
MLLNSAQGCATSLSHSDVSLRKHVWTARSPFEHFRVHCSRFKYYASLPNSMVESAKESGENRVPRIPGSILFLSGDDHRNRTHHKLRAVRVLLEWLGIECDAVRVAFVDSPAFLVVYQESQDT